MAIFNSYVSLPDGTRFYKHAPSTRRSKLSFCGSGTREIVDEDANCESKSMNWLKRLWTSHSWWFSRTRMAYHVAPSKSELWSTWIWTLMATTSLSPLLKLFTIAAGTCGSFKILPNACWGHLEVFVSVQHIQYIINAHPNCLDPFWEKKHLDIWMDCSQIPLITPLNPRCFPTHVNRELSPSGHLLNTERHCEGIWSSDRPPEQNT